MTRRLYWEDDHALTATATCIAVDGHAVAFDQTCFYAGGGGQPPDLGTIRFERNEPNPVQSIHTGEDGRVWHTLAAPPPADAVGQAAELTVDAARREALSRYHTVLHVLNTIAQRDHQAWITGAQIATDYARIDFHWDGFHAGLREELERKVNAVLAVDHPIHAYWLTEAEFAQRPELLRTLEVKPPVIAGHVRVVEIQGFDAQACGGTHIPTTARLGRFAITKTENKGRLNKRLYVNLNEIE